MSTNIGTYSISDVGNELAGQLHGSTLNQIQDLYGAFNRAARRILGDIDPQETKIVKQFGKLYDGVFDYSLDTDVKGNKIIDLFPQANRNLRDNFQQVYNKDFDLWKNLTLVPDFTPRYAGGFRTIRINATNLNTGISVNDANGYNTNGTWTAGSHVSSVATNTQYTTDGGSGSVSFSIAQTGIASTAIITNSTMASVNLSDHYNNGDEFFNVYFPNASGITSITYRFGSDTTGTTNYYDSGAITTDQMGNAFVNGWNFLKIPWSSFAITGTPDNTAIAYIKITIAYNGTLQTQVLLNQFWSRLGVIFNYEYYSKYLFRDATTGVFKEKVTADSDVVNLDTDGMNLYTFAILGEVVQQQQGLDALFFDANQAETRYQAELISYRSKYRSEISKPHTAYYTTPRASYRRYMGGTSRP